MPITATATVAPPPSYPHEILKTPLRGQISATTRSPSVTRTVSPAAANRTYSLSRLLSTSMPTDLTELGRSDWQALCRGTRTSNVVRITCGR